MATPRTLETTSVKHHEVETADLSLDDVHAKYAKEWVALDVTELAGTEVITRGRIVQHSPSRGVISKAVKRFRRTKPEAHIYIFLAGPTRITHAERRASLRGQAFQKYISASW